MALSTSVPTHTAHINSEYARVESFTPEILNLPTIYFETIEWLWGRGYEVYFMGGYCAYQLKIAPLIYENIYLYVNTPADSIEEFSINDIIYKLNIDIYPEFQPKIVEDYKCSYVKGIVTLDNSLDVVFLRHNLRPRELATKLDIDLYKCAGVWSPNEKSFTFVDMRITMKTPIQEANELFDLYPDMHVRHLRSDRGDRTINQLYKLYDMVQGQNNDPTLECQSNKCHNNIIFNDLDVMEQCRRIYRLIKCIDGQLFTRRRVVFYEMLGKLLVA